jgi:hypothetical protein
LYQTPIGRNKEEFERAIKQLFPFVEESHNFVETLAVYGIGEYTYL